jgi:HPt (histidine-containing phosphotransfer) domain-containing protein
MTAITTALAGCWPDSCSDPTRHSAGRRIIPKNPSRGRLHHATAPAPAFPPVDLDRLREVTGQDEQEIRELVDLYLQQTAADIAELQAAISAGSTRDVERLAHGCAGASMNCGMVGIAPLFKELEHAAREDRLTDGALWCAAIAEAFERIKGFLHTSQLPA